MNVEGRGVVMCSGQGLMRVHPKFLDCKFFLSFLHNDNIPSLVSCMMETLDANHSASQVANWTGIWPGSGEMHALFADYFGMISDLRAQCMGDRLPLSSGDSTRLLASGCLQTLVDLALLCESRIAGDPQPEEDVVHK